MVGIDLEERFAVGASVAADAGAIAKGFFDRRRELAVELKGAQDLVSVADREVETAIVGELLARFPGDAVLGEEHGLQGGGNVVWLIDPIDGTTNFVRGVAFWCVSIGLLVDNVPTLGFIYDPIQDELFAGRRGGGATCNGRKMRVSTAEPARARVNLGFNFKQPVDRFVQVLQRLVQHGSEFARYGSSALSLAYVADGRLEGFWENRINAWDVCAGLVLAREAGAVVDDFFAGEGPARVNSCFAGAPSVVEAMRAAVAG
jgi:myo-inositol-1(or 4)-monophosphatase